MHEKNTCGEPHVQAEDASKCQYKKCKASIQAVVTELNGMDMLTSALEK